MKEKTRQRVEMNSISVTLLAWLQKRRLTNAEGAVRLGVPKATFEQWLYGRHRPTTAARKLIEDFCK